MVQQASSAVADRVRTWAIDPAHSHIEFSAKHMMFTTVKGRFGQVKGTLTVDDGDPTRSRVDVEIDANSIDTGTDQRDTHLRSADFLDVENNPVITFTSTNVEVVSEDELKVTGDLTIRGVTRPVTLKTTINGRGTNPFGKQVAGFSAETSINRKDFGLNWNVAIEAGGVLVSETVKISLEIQAVKEA